MSEEHTPEEENREENQSPQETIRPIDGMYQDWFLDYASYVILERAVPAIEDGFKPVHRRIMHSMKDLDDGRYNKVANIVGHTMQYHPHGDASIGDAMVQMGQKELLIDTQGNWGNIFTGDRAAAPRYIEARLSKFALEVVFNPKVTEWQSSYDGRKKEPINLPAKFPLLLTHGAEGIAVGLSTKILPHNFNELIDASIKHLKGKGFKLFPDFPTGGIMDTSKYNEGLRGGKIRVRAKITQKEDNVLSITEIPFSTNTSSLIDSILKANDKGKIKIKRVEDNTAGEVEINIKLAKSLSPDKMIDALYAFTNCELSISPLSCVIYDNSPEFVGVTEILKRSTDRTLNLLKLELEIKLHELREKWHFASLERIFIENRIYRDIEEEETWEGVISAIDKGLQPHIKHLTREVTEEDIVRLTEIKIKRISKFDLDKAQQKIEALEGEIDEVIHHLNNLVDFAIDYFKGLKKKFGEGRERKTEIQRFEDIEAAKVVIRNTKLYVNRKEGFIGTGLKKSEHVLTCSDIDDIICFTENGIMKVVKVDSKVFIGKKIIHVAIFKKKDKRTIYNLIYQNGKGGNAYMKRFPVTSITRNRDYSMSKGKPGTRVLYFSANPNGEAEIVNVQLRQKGKLKKLKFDVDLAEMDIKSKAVKGNLVSKHPIKRIELKEKGVSTLKPRKIWFDETVKRLNTEERGVFLGNFKGDDRLLLVTQDGVVKTLTPEITHRFDDQYTILKKWNPEIPISAVYWEGGKERYYIKRFLVENPGKEEKFISDHKDSFLELVSTAVTPRIELVFKKKKGKDRKDNEEINLKEFISVKGINALGNRLTTEEVLEINFLEPLEPEATENPDDLENDEDKDQNSDQPELF
jgi:topoisomerase-4 subunit A